MVDIRAEARQYAERHPYEFIRIKPESDRSISHGVRMTEQPDPALALMLGDFVHNLRSALDHIIVASVPKEFRKTAGFPIISEDIFAKDSNGGFMSNDAKARENFERSIEGLDPRAKAIVIWEQPYQYRRDRDRCIFGIISRLDNTDKHRALTTFGAGVTYPIGELTVRNITGTLPRPSIRHHSFAQEGTIVHWVLPAYWQGPNCPVPSDVNVKYSGTAVVHVKIARVGGNKSPEDYPLLFIMLSAMAGVRRLLRTLDPFVIR